jgi:hypothetical protein
METYFDLLPEDMLLILLKKDRTFKDVNHVFKKLFDTSLQIILLGKCNPLEYFNYTYDDRLRIKTYCPDYDLIKSLNGTQIYMTSKEIENIINGCPSMTYLNDVSFDYDGFVYYISQVDRNAYINIMKGFNIDPMDTSSKVFYIYVEVQYNSIGGRVEIHVNNIWNDFWNMKLNSYARLSLMKENNWWNTKQLKNEIDLNWINTGKFI